MADSGIKRNIPIKLGDFSVIDTEFSNIRERFDAEMRKMEDEMSRFRSELMNRESNNFFKSTTRYVRATSSLSRINPDSPEIPRTRRRCRSLFLSLSLSRVSCASLRDEFLYAQCIPFHDLVSRPTNRRISGAWYLFTSTPGRCVYVRDTGAGISYARVSR